MASVTPPRRRFQFRLRTLFVIVTIVAIQCEVCLPMLREWQARNRTHTLVERLRGLVHMGGGYRESRRLSAGASPNAASKRA
jgi:hypothetical protein